MLTKEALLHSVEPILDSFKEQKVSRVILRWVLVTIRKLLPTWGDFSEET